MKIISVVTIILVVIACNQDNETLSNQDKNCLGLPEETPYYSSCENVDSFYFMYYCDISKFGTIKLETNSKQFISLFCEDIGKILTFQNDNGNKIQFELIYKIYNKDHVIVPTNQKCLNDSTKRVAFCTDIDEVLISLRSIDKSTKLNICLKPEFDYRNISTPTYGDFLYIERFYVNKYINTEFYAVISPRTLSYSIYYNQINYDSLKLGSKFYKNVITNDKTGNPKPSMNYYYNKESGLIGFKDTLDQLWYRTN